MKKLSIIYIPGLGDSYDGLRQYALKKWASQEREIIFVPMLWDDKTELFSHKLDRIHDAIQGSSGKVILVGESAGAATALVAMHQFGRDVAQVITLAGKNHGAEDVQISLYRRHPAFREAMVRADKVVEGLSQTKKNAIKIFYSEHDYTVRPKYSLIDGVAHYKVFGLGHGMTISLLLTINRSKIFQQLKRP